MSILNLTADVSEIRLDKYLADEIEILSRSRIKRYIEAEAVSVNGKLEKPSYILQGGETIRIEIPETRPYTVESEEIPLDILHEDEEIIVLNKPPGLVIHPGAGNPGGTLVNGLVYHFNKLSGISGKQRAGIVHRLDKDTSGVLVVAKTDESHMALAEQFGSRTVKKVYVGVVWGTFGSTGGTVDAPIARHHRYRQRFTVAERGKPSVTQYNVLKEFDYLTLVELLPETGRTHQIRVHMAFIHHPVFADETYGGGKEKVKGYASGPRDFLLSLYSVIQRQALHAKALSFCHPKSGERMTFSAPLSKDFQTLVEELESRHA